MLVFDSQSELVGATTCIPLGDEGPEFQRPFLAAGWEVRQICYFGESIVLPEFRGRGLGREFFKIRERHAREHGCRWTCFCAVDRAGQHPMRPKSYRPLDDFWTSLGYMKRPALKASFTWRETGEKFESPKSLTFWTKEWKS